MDLAAPIRWRDLHEVVSRKAVWTMSVNWSTELSWFACGIRCISRRGPVGVASTDRLGGHTAGL